MYFKNKSCLEEKSYILNLSKYYFNINDNELIYAANENENMELFNYTSLWQHVIQRQIFDAAGINLQKSQIKLQIDAIKWLFIDNKDFNEVCDYAGFAPKIIREIAYNFIFLKK